MKEPEAVAAFEKLKAALVGPDVMLRHPDYAKRFRVELDASMEQVGGVLCQQDKEGVWKPVEFSEEMNEESFAPAPEG